MPKSSMPKRDSIQRIKPICFPIHFAAQKASEETQQVPGAFVMITGRCAHLLEDLVHVVGGVGVPRHDEVQRRGRAVAARSRKEHLKTSRSFRMNTLSPGKMERARQRNAQMAAKPTPQATGGPYCWLQDNGMCNGSVWSLQSKDRGLGRTAGWADQESTQ